jgi:hypothetical protein
VCIWRMKDVRIAKKLTDRGMSWRCTVRNALTTISGWERLFPALKQSLESRRSDRLATEKRDRKSQRHDLVVTAYRKHLKTLNPTDVPFLPTPAQCLQFGPLFKIAEPDVVDLTDQWHQDVRVAVVEAYSLMLQVLLKHKRYLVSMLASDPLESSTVPEGLVEDELDAKLALATSVYGERVPYWGLEQVIEKGDRRMTYSGDYVQFYSQTPRYPFSASHRSAVLAVLSCLGKGPTSTVTDLDMADERLLCLACRQVYSWRGAVSFSASQRHIYGQ